MVWLFPAGSQMVWVNGLHTTSMIENQNPHTGGAIKPCAQILVTALTWHTRKAADGLRSTAFWNAFAFCGFHITMCTSN